MMKTYKQLINEYKEGSPDTSTNQIAGALKKINWKPGTINLDFGGGKYETSTDYLRKNHDVINHVYDPYNRSGQHNRQTWVNTKYAPTTTIMNVLNVVAEKEERQAIIKKAKRPGTKTMYITVYEKRGDGKGEETSKGWQNNMKTEAYMEEIKEIFPQAKRKGKIIVITF